MNDKLKIKNFISGKTDNTDLYSHRPFWWPIVITCIVGFIAFLTIVVSKKIDMLECWTSECWNYAVTKTFKVPLSIVGLGLVLSGFVATIFRSTQTYLQYAESVKQNIFKNYLDHVAALKNLLKRFEEHENGKKIEATIFQSEEMYRRYFPNNNYRRLSLVSESGPRERSFLSPKNIGGQLFVEVYRKKNIDVLEEHANVLRNLVAEQRIKEVALSDGVLDVKLWFLEFCCLVDELGIRFGKSVVWEVGHISKSGRMREILFPEKFPDAFNHVLNLVADLYWFGKQELIPDPYIAEEYSKLIMQKLSSIRKHPR